MAYKTTGARTGCSRLATHRHTTKHGWMICRKKSSTKTGQPSAECCGLHTTYRWRWRRGWLACLATAGAYSGIDHTRSCGNSWLWWNVGVAGYASRYGTRVSQVWSSYAPHGCVFCLYIQCDANTGLELRVCGDCVLTEIPKSMSGCLRWLRAVQSWR